ncbi:Thiamine-monophosphate kinase [Raoultella planticola]|uniref:Thiamine-monophosphate kinase n=1 Tax=Raoultella planticola TaxID=575 RepID=A0A485DAY6_RAOPL|nr:Thiamine-monophosphate kinase [Raoultella planticola]
MTLGIHGFCPARTRSEAFRCEAWRLDIRHRHPGDSAAGLAILQDRLVVESAADADYLLARHLRPMPRVLQGQALRDLASSAIDLSDGLISDLGHILKASGCGARIDLGRDAGIRCAAAPCGRGSRALRWALSGGEDYELCFTGA